MTQLISTLRLRRGLRPADPAARPVRALRFALAGCLALFALACSGSKPAPGPAAGESFEGVITSKTLIGEDSMEVTTAVKGLSTRSETSGSIAGRPYSSIVLMDLKTGSQTILFPETGKYTTSDLKEDNEQLQQAMEEMKRNAGGADIGPKVKPLGTKETIAGYECENWLFETQPITLQMCLTTGLGFVGATTDREGNGLELIKKLNPDPQIMSQLEAQPEFKKFSERGFYPMKMAVVENGQSKTTTEVTKVERKKLEDSIFAIPPGYTKSSMSEALGLPRVNLPEQSETKK
jgi:hypothetical protein